MTRRRSTTRTSPIRILRALWRYRRTITAHGDRYQTEVAVAVRSAIEANLIGSVGLTGYRMTMRTLMVGAIGLVIVGLLLALALWQVTPLLVLLALVPVAAGLLLLWWRFTIGAPLDWLDEHDDPARSVPLAELPSRLHELAIETRSIANVPARLADELDALARESAASTPPSSEAPSAATPTSDGPFLP